MKKKCLRKMRKTLSKPGLLDVTRSCFEKIDDTVSGRGFTLTDYLMSGLAVFSLKYDSPCSPLTSPRATNRTGNTRQPEEPLRGHRGSVGFCSAKAS